MSDPRTAEVDPDEVTAYLIHVMQSERRLDGSPAYLHPVRMRRIMESRFQVSRHELIAAGLLHDVIEDTAVSREELALRFGEEVATRVEAQTHVGISETLVPDPNERRLLRYENKLKRIPHWDVGNCVILCADILDNLFHPNGDPDPYCKELYKSAFALPALAALHRRLEELAWEGSLPMALVDAEAAFLGIRPLVSIDFGR